MNDRPKAYPPGALRRLRSRRARRQGGFNFAEVLFAVMILGIGFIMVAAIFPVALMQTKTTQEESAGASIARGGANYLEQIAANATMPATANQVRCLDRMLAVKGTMLVTADNRYAWVPFYRRIGTVLEDAPYVPQPDWAAFAQVYMVPVVVRNSSVFEKGITQTIGDISGPADPPIVFPILLANVVDSTCTAPFNNAEGVDYIEFPANKGENDTNDNYKAVAEGTYVIIANAGDPVGAVGRVGHIFRVGNPTAGQPAAGYPRRWELMPANDYVPLGGDWDGDGTLTGVLETEGPLYLEDAEVFVVGRGLTDPSLAFSSANARDGNGQDVAAYTTFVTIR